ncbi:MAG TPA: helix-turn-helix transcriptional regulator [Ensifer sp.]|nr:helix-turn-helix transcriptional regulator [Ensifer sp.]
MDVEWKTLRAELPTEVQARLDARRAARRLGKALAEVRKEMNVTQREIATRASMTQNTVSKIENAEDILLSSVVRYMHSLGGSVELTLKTPDGGMRKVDLEAEMTLKG